MSPEFSLFWLHSYHISINMAMNHLNLAQIAGRGFPGFGYRQFGLHSDHLFDSQARFDLVRPA